MVLESGKCQLVCLGNVQKSKVKKVLGIIIDSKHKFRVHKKNYLRELFKRSVFCHV